MPTNDQPAKMCSGRFREPVDRTFEQWQRSLLLCIGFAACATLPPTATAAQNKRTAERQMKCSQRMIEELEAQSERIRDWSKLRDFYYRYRECGVEDAEVETGRDSSVVRIIIEDWSSLVRANLLFIADPEFKKFALSGLNITDSTEDLNRIDKLSAEHCAPRLHDLCRDIRDSIRNNN